MSNDQSNLYELYFRLVWLERRYQLQKLKEFGPMANPHQGQGRILSLLKMKPEISQKDLSTILNIRSQSLGELLAKLERSGYITRTPSEADRRVIQICLTDEGKKVANQTEKQFENINLFRCLSEEEQIIIGGYFKRIIKDLENQFEDDESELYNRATFNMHGDFKRF